MTWTSKVFDWIVLLISLSGAALCIRIAYGLFLLRDDFPDIFTDWLLYAALAATGILFIGSFAALLLGRWRWLQAAPFGAALLLNAYLGIKYGYSWNDLLTAVPGLFGLTWILSRYRVAKASGATVAI